MSTGFNDFSVSVPVSNSSRGERDKKRDDPVALIGGLSVSDKKRLVAQYGDLSNDEDELYPPFNVCVCAWGECCRKVACVLASGWVTACK